MAIQSGAAILKPLMPWVDTFALLTALAEVESAYGKHNVPRYEKAYTPMNRYFDKDQKERWGVWGAWAACSYSSFQIMYPTACELGFDSAPWSRSPAELFDDTNAIIWVVEYIKRRVLRAGVTSIRDFADVYNSGSLKDGNVPMEYIKKFEGYYLFTLSKKGVM